MKINLEVTHSCTIKRKKPWPKISWIGKEKEHLFLLDYQRISLIDPKNGKTKRKVSKLTPIIKSLISFNISDDGIHFVGILNTGDIFIWNKDNDLVKNINGRNEFALKLGFHCPSLFVSNDTKKLVLITSRNKVFVWETDNMSDSAPSDKLFGLFNSNSQSNKIDGNWSDIVASKDIKTVEDNKELVLDARFNSNPINGTSATCCFAFNYENRLVVNVLRIKWLSPSEITSQSQCRFETLWICYQPNELSINNSYCLSANKDKILSAKMNCLYTRGAYVIKLSHCGDLLALVSNQKYVENSCLTFMSPSNGATFPVNLRNFGLNNEARGRHYWIQELTWMFNDLYLAGITKHGAIFLVSRLGHPLLIHAIGKEINIGPALYLTIHPLIIIRGKSASVSQNQSGDGSMSSTLENDEPLRQRYSIKNHPSLPIFVCSDGYLMCIFKLQTAFSTQSRLIRELMHETIGLLNSVSETVAAQNEDYYRLNNPFESFENENESKQQTSRNKKVIKSETRLKRRVSFSSEVDLDADIPDWGLNTNSMQQAAIQSEKSSDSGVEANDGGRDKNRKRSDSFGNANTKIAEGKIIFSYLPQIMPISMETLKTGSIVNKMENAFEYLQSSWSLLTSMKTSEAIRNTHECDQTAKSIQQSFTHFSYLFLTLDTEHLKEFQIYKNEFAASTNRKQQQSLDLSTDKIDSKLEEDFKLKVLVDLFIRMLKILYFDPACKYNPNSHMIIYVPRFAEKFMQSLLKFESIFSNESPYSITRTNLFGLVYTLLNVCESLLKSIYKLKQNEKFFLTTDPIISQRVLINPKPTTNSSYQPRLLPDSNEKVKDATNTNPKENAEISVESIENQIEPANQEEDLSAPKTDQTNNSKHENLLVKSTNRENVEFVDLMFEKCWSNLMHYACKYRNKLEMLGSIRRKQLKDLDIFIILLERRLQKFPPIFNKKLTSKIGNEIEQHHSSKQINYDSIHKRSQIFKINKADLIYLDLGNIDAAIDEWILQLNIHFDSINSFNSMRKQQSLNRTKIKNQNLKSLINKSIKIAHKIFYCCLANYRLKKLIMFINSYFVNDMNQLDNESNDDSISSSYYSPFNLSKNTFKYLQPPKPLKKTHLAIVSVIKSLARLMAIYFSNLKSLFIYSINNPTQMPNIIDEFKNYNSSIPTLLIQNTNEKIRIELSRERFTAFINQSLVEPFVQSDYFQFKTFEKVNLSLIFNTDKALELFLVTGLYDEAVYFSNLINDWKSSYLISSILKESENYNALNMLNELPEQMKPEKLLSNKLCSILGLDRINENSKTNLNYMKLMEKSEIDDISLIIKELLLSSVMTKSNTLEPLLNLMMESLVFYTNEISFNSVIVPDDFYLPAPPIYCIQMQTDEEQDLQHHHHQQDTLAKKNSFLIEKSLRIKLYVVCKCIIVLLVSSNLHSPLIKWYLEQLLHSSIEMKQKYGIQNLFQMNFSLRTLLTSIRYQKIGYIPENILFIFREFCAILFYLDLRDKFTFSLRQYSRHFIQNQTENDNEFNSKTSVQMCLKIIDYGNALLSYRSFLRNHHAEIQDIVLSTISRLTKINQLFQMKDLNLEIKLACCVEKKSFSSIETKENNSNHDFKNDDSQTINSESFETKLKKLLETWRTIRARSDETNSSPEKFISMADAYEYSILASQRSSNAKLNAIYGSGEDNLYRIYDQKSARMQPYVCGGYDFERTYWCSDFIELFFKLAFDQTEEWQSLIQSVNQTPLLPEFYETIRDQQMTNSDFVDKQYIIAPLNTKKSQENQNSDVINISPLNSRRRRSILSNLGTQSPKNSLRQLSPNKIIVEDLVYENTSDANLKNYDLTRQKGLFRSYSIKSLNEIKKSDKFVYDEPSKIVKSVSFLNLASDELESNNNNEDDLKSINSDANVYGSLKKNNSEDSSDDHNNKSLSELDQPLKVLDYGIKYAQTSNLSIWLIKWASQFQKILMNHKKAAKFWYNDTNHLAHMVNNKSSQTITLKLNSINANLLVGAVYLSDNNNLEFTSMNQTIVTRSANKRSRSKHQSRNNTNSEIDDDFTQISTSVSFTSKQINDKPAAKSIEKAISKTKIRDEYSSTSLDISSMTENQVKNYITSSQQPQHQQQQEPLQQAPLKEKHFQSKKEESQSPIKEIILPVIDSRASSTERNQLNQSYGFNKVKDENSQKDDLSLTSTLEASEFYNLKNVKRIQSPKPPLNDQSSVQQAAAINLKEDNSNKSQKSFRLGSFDFITNIFKNRKDKSGSQSPSRSKSPSKSSLFSPSPTKQFDKQQIIKQFEQKNQEQKLPFDQNLPSSFRNEANQNGGTNDVYDIIKSELRKIVQLQHDTVMNFLNGGTDGQNGQSQQTNVHLARAQQLGVRSQPSNSQSFNSIEQQLSAILKQQHVRRNSNGDPVEFIIETKIKAIDTLTGQATTNPPGFSSTTSPDLEKSFHHHHHQQQQQQQQNMNRVTVPLLQSKYQNDENKNYFMKKFDNKTIENNKPSAKSNLIKIPLLTSHNDASSALEARNQHILNMEHQHPTNYPTHFPLIEQNKFDSKRNSCLQQFDQQREQQNDFPLLDFKSERRLQIHRSILEIESNNEIHQQKIAATLLKSDSQQLTCGINKHVKDFIDASTKSASLNYRNFPLLKLGYQKEIKEEKPVLVLKQDKSVSPIEPITPEPASPTEPNKTQKEPMNTQKESRETQVQRPMYDGYILAPEAFNDMLNQNNNNNDQISSARAHYDSTQHLRDTQRQIEMNKNKKDAFTITESLPNANPIPPDILFKLQFDTNRKDREIFEEDGSLGKDYVNIVDLDPNAVEDILKLIEHEQNKRQGKYVSVNPKKPEPIKSNADVPTRDDTTHFVSDQLDQDKNQIDGDVPPLDGDALTKHIFDDMPKDEDDWKKYDEIMKRQIEELTKEASASTNKQKIANELQYIDEQIKLMNRMANDMSSDYDKYDKILSSIQDLAKQRETIEKRQQKEIQLDKPGHSKEREDVKFYERKEADDQINDLKKEVLKPKPKPRPISKHQPRQKVPSEKEKPLSKEKQSEPTQTKLIQKLKKPETPKEPILDLNLDDEDLSSLKDEDEIKLRKMLGDSLNLTSVDSKLDTGSSFTKVIKDVFNDLDIETAQDIDSEKLDEIIERSTSPRKSTKIIKPKEKPDTRFKSISPKRPVPSKPIPQRQKDQRRSSETSIKSKPTKPATDSLETTKERSERISKKLNTTYDKTPRKISPVVYKEKEMSDKREVLHEIFTQQREEEAKNLLRDMIVDNIQMNEMEKKLDQTSQLNTSFGSQASLKRQKSLSPSQKFDRLKKSIAPSPVPSLVLDQSTTDVQTSEMNLKNKKPSLMARTIIELEKKESLKQSETTRLLKDLERRANLVTKPPITNKKPVKIIKSFTDYVHLQEPSKLRDHPEHKPLTYGQVLMQHQESTIAAPTSKTSSTQLYKIYGTHRIPGLYKSYVKQSPRKTKSYTQILHELQPTESQALIRPKLTTNLQQPKRNRTQQNRKLNPSKPYTTLLKELQDNKATVMIEKPKTNTKHNLQTKARPNVNIHAIKIINHQRRFTPYKSPYQQDTTRNLNEIDDLSTWSMDDKIKNILYDDHLKPSKQDKNLRISKKHVTYKDADQDTLADTDADFIQELLEDEKQNEKIYQHVLKDLSNLEKKEKGLSTTKNSLDNNDDDYDAEQEDYVNMVNIDDLKNVSLSSESLMSSYIDWDQIDNLIENLK